VRWVFEVKLRRKAVRTREAFGRRDA